MYKLILLLILVNSLLSVKANNKDSIVLAGVVRECGFNYEKVIDAVIYIVIYKERKCIAYTIMKKDGSFSMKIPRIFLSDTLKILSSQLLETNDSVSRPTIYDYSDSQTENLNLNDGDAINNYKFCCGKVLRCGPGPRFFFELKSTKFITDYIADPDSVIRQIKNLLNQYPTLKLGLMITVADDEDGKRLLQKRRLKKVKELIIKSGIAPERITMINNFNNLLGCEPKGKYALECHTQISIVTISI